MEDRMAPLSRPQPPNSLSLFFSCKQSVNSSKLVWVCLICMLSSFIWLFRMDTSSLWGYRGWGWYLVWYRRHRIVSCIVTF